MKLNEQLKLNDVLSGDLKKSPTREGFGKALVALGEQDPSVVALTADVTESVRVHYFAEKFPQRFFQCGVAEQNMAGVAAGFSYAGKIPFMAAYAVFNPGRNYDQIRTAVCYADANVKIAASHAGLTVGPDGATHQALEDIALMRSLPNMTVIVPCDYNEAYKATVAAHANKGPFYLRFSREKCPEFTSEETPFEVGRPLLLKDGDDVAIIACGMMVYEALIAANELEKQGISAAVLNMHTLSHPDHNVISRLAKSCGTIVTVEEHQVKGGLGSAVAEVVCDYCPVPVRRIGMPMEFGESGEGYELLKHYGLYRDNIAKVAKEQVSNKK